MSRNDINKLNKKFTNLILGFDREKSKVKELTLTNSRYSVKSKNQTESKDYENYLFRK